MPYSPIIKFCQWCKTKLSARFRSSWNDFASIFVFGRLLILGKRFDFWWLGGVYKQNSNLTDLTSMNKLNLEKHTLPHIRCCTQNRWRMSKPYAQISVSEITWCSWLQWCTSYCNQKCLKMGLNSASYHAHLTLWLIIITKWNNKTLALFRIFVRWTISTSSCWPCA